MVNVWINSPIVAISIVAAVVFLILFFYSDDRKEYLSSSAYFLQSSGASSVSFLQSSGASSVSFLQSFGVGLEILKSVALSLTVDLLDAIITLRVFVFGLSVFLVTIGFIYKQDSVNAYVEAKEVSSELLKGVKEAVQAVFCVLSKPVNVLSYALVVILINAYPILVDRISSGVLKQAKLS